MLDAMLFDLDGTLTETDALHLLALQQLLEEEGRAFTEEEFKKHISGRANADLCRYLFPERDAQAHRLFADRKEQRFRDLSPKLKPMAGLVCLLEFAKSREIDRVVVTNAPRANADHMLGALGLLEHFNDVVVAEDLERAKPDPLPYLTGLARLGARADHALAFEDSLPGLTAALKAGIFTVALSTSQSRETLKAAGAHLVIDDFNDPRLWQILEQRLG